VTWGHVGTGLEYGNPYCSIRHSSTRTLIGISDVPVWEGLLFIALVANVQIEKLVDVAAIMQTLVCKISFISL